MQALDVQSPELPDTLIEAIDLPLARWDRQARLISCNAPYLGWAARPREALLGRSLAELYGEAAWDSAQRAFARAFAGRAASYDQLLTHLASPRWVRVRVFPERRGADAGTVCTLAFDIHDDVLQREEREAAYRRLNRFAENIPYPLTYMDRDCVLRFVNQAYIRAAGMPAEALVGCHIGDVRGPQRWLEQRAYFERALGGETVHYTRQAELADHGRRWVRTSYVPDFEDGEVRGLYTVMVDVHDLSLSQEQLKRSVERDALTDTLSRRAMMDRLGAALAEAASTPVALYFVDLDGMKAVNDALGHHEGDRVLCAAARALVAAVRAGDAVGRFGGDEFLVLAPVHDRGGAHKLALHLLEAVRATGNPVTASIGYALAPADATEASKLVELADNAMYAAKRLGKDRVMTAGAD